MRPIFTLLAGATIILSSCSSSHKVSQTPDDVYYSPGASHATAAANTSNEDEPEYYSTRPSDQYVQMKSVDQARWSYFDDYNDYDNYYAAPPMGGGAYYGSPAYGYGYGYGSSAISLGMGFWDPYFGWNSYFMWNTYYNPYFYNPYYGGGVFAVNNKYPASAPFYNHLRAFNPSSYYANGFVNGNTNTRFYRPGTTSSSPGGRIGNNNNYYRPVNTGGFGGSAPVRSFNPVGGGGGGGGSFSRPGRH